MNGTRWVLALIAVLSLGTACSDSSTGRDARAGALMLHLTTPHADDGAMLFVVSGPPIDSATAANASLRLFTRRAGGSTTVLVVVGAVTNGAVVTLRVPAIDAAAEYTARVLEVADRQNALRGSLTGYALTVIR